MTGMSVKIHAQAWFGLTKYILAKYFAADSGMYCNFLQRILRLVAGYDTMPGFFACIYLYKK